MLYKHLRDCGEVSQGFNAALFCGYPALELVRRDNTTPLHFEEGIIRRLTSDQHSVLIRKGMTFYLAQHQSKAANQRLVEV